MTTFEVEPTHRRAWGEEQLEALFAEGFPPFITADLAVKPWIGRVREFFPHLDIVLIDDGQPVATGWGVPIAWDGRPEDLPESFAGILRRAVALHEAGATADSTFRVTTARPSRRRAPCCGCPASPRLRVRHAAGLPC